MSVASQKCTLCSSLEQTSLTLVTIPHTLTSWNIILVHSPRGVTMLVPSMPLNPSWNTKSCSACTTSSCLAFSFAMRARQVFPTDIDSEVRNIIRSYSIRRSSSIWSMSRIRRLLFFSTICLISLIYISLR